MLYRIVVEQGTSVCFETKHLDRTILVTCLSNALYSVSSIQNKYI